MDTAVVSCVAAPLRASWHRHKGSQAKQFLFFITANAHSKHTAQPSRHSSVFKRVRTAELFLNHTALCAKPSSCSSSSRPPPKPGKCRAWPTFYGLFVPGLRSLPCALGRQMCTLSALNVQPFNLTGCTTCTFTPVSEPGLPQHRGPRRSEA